MYCTAVSYTPLQLRSVVSFLARVKNRRDSLQPLNMAFALHSACYLMLCRKEIMNRGRVPFDSSSRSWFTGRSVHRAQPLERSPQVMRYGRALNATDGNLHTCMVQPSPLLQMGRTSHVKIKITYNTTTSAHRFMINFDLASDRNLASWLGDTGIDLRCTTLLSTLPILVRPALWIFTQTSFIFM